MQAKTLWSILGQFQLLYLDNDVSGVEVDRKTVGQWITGRAPIPNGVAQRLLHLSGAYEELRLQVFESARDADDHVAYWPTYKTNQDFQRIDSQRYQLFLGCHRIYAKAIYHAEEALLYHLSMQQQDLGQIKPYVISTETYLPWLKQQGYQNDEQRRREYVQVCWERFTAMDLDVLGMQRQATRSGDLSYIHGQRKLNQVLARLQAQNVSD